MIPSLSMPMIMRWPIPRWVGSRMVLIEDCYDLADEDTTGYFCRILAGAWDGLVSGHGDPKF